VAGRTEAGGTGAGCIGAFATIAASYSSSDIVFTSDDCNVTMLPDFSSLVFTAPPRPALSTFVV
jgi:hypothetical protein